MNKRTYTILVVPEHSSKVRRFMVSHQLFVNGAVVVAGLLALLTFGAVHYGYVVDQANGNRALKEENVVLATRLRLLQEDIGRVDGQLQRIEQFADKLRGIIELNDPQRNLAIGPIADDAAQRPPEVLYAPGERIEYEDELIDSKLALRLVDSSLDSLGEKARHQEASIRDIHQYFSRDGVAPLATIPSVRPIRSKLLTSGFGMRTDPYTNRRVMHKGVDFVSEHGADVVVTGDGIVIYAGNRGGYGKTLVIDHGYGYQTHYAHLSSYKCTVGQRVQRGQTIGTVGNTGRSTGPHLHYEVRFVGVPQDPERFVIE